MSEAKFQRLGLDSSEQASLTRWLNDNVAPAEDSEDFGFSVMREVLLWVALRKLRASWTREGQEPQ